MLGHIILNRRNKEGSIFVPEVDMQLKACPGGRRGWIEVRPTDGMRYDMKKWPPTPIMPIVEWLKKTCEFVKEVDVPLLMIRFAIEAEEKKRKQIEAFGGLLEGMVKEKLTPLDLRQESDHRIMMRAVRQVSDIVDSKEPGEISEAKKYAMALQIQRWIHEAGGLC
jgi:hypothetical protein